MNLEGLFIIAFGSAFAIFWLINYIPITAKLTKKVIFSPRLMMCKLLAPFDAAFTIILIIGGWVGLSTTVTGIGMMTFNVLTGIGLSLGVLFVKKFMVPRWEEKFQQEKLRLSR
jgi:hypothetical protein